MGMNRFLRLWWTVVRTMFRLLYGPFAWTYDGVAWLVSLGQWTAWGRVALRYLEGQPVLGDLPRFAIPPVELAMEGLRRYDEWRNCSRDEVENSQPLQEEYA